MNLKTINSVSKSTQSQHALVSSSAYHIKDYFMNQEEFEYLFLWFTITSSHSKEKFHHQQSSK